MFRSICIALFACTMVASEPAIQAVGVIGNAGEQGDSLIRQTMDQSYRGHGNTVGCGIAIDRLGTLWVRMDDTMISRLSLDGRLLAQFSAARSANGYDTIALLGDQVLLLANGQLQRLSIDAKPGSAFTAMGVSLRGIAHTPVKGHLAAITEDGTIVWINEQGIAATIATMPDAWMIEADGSGSLYVGTRSKSDHDDGLMHKLVNGKEVVVGDWPKPWPVIRPGIAVVPTFLTWIDGTFFEGGNGHVSAFDADLNPSPGTVLGMQGKFVIGVGADWRNELGAARGIVRLRDRSFAIGGAGGQPFFAEWPDSTRSMNLVAWISGRAGCPALAIDGDGHVFVDRLVYDWNATPEGFPEVLQGGAGVASAMVRAGPHVLVRQDRWSHGSGSWALPIYSGPAMDKGDWIGSDHLDVNWWERANTNREKVFASAIYPQDDGYVLLTLADMSGAKALRLHGNGRFKDVIGDVMFTFKQGGDQLTDLAMLDATTMLAAVDGQVVEMNRNNTGWTEQRRWNSWGKGTTEHFGATIHLASDPDTGSVLVSDSDRHRVVWFANGKGRPLAQFGATDVAGADLGSLNSPGLIAVCGQRAIVHDHFNQRLVKLELVK